MKVDRTSTSQWIYQEEVQRKSSRNPLLFRLTHFTHLANLLTYLLKNSLKWKPAAKSAENIADISRTHVFIMTFTLPIEEFQETSHRVKFETFNLINTCN